MSDPKAWGFVDAFRYQPDSWKPVDGKPRQAPDTLYRQLPNPLQLPHPLDVLDLLVKMIQRDASGLALELAGVTPRRQKTPGIDAGAVRTRLANMLAAVGALCQLLDITQPVSEAAERRREAFIEHLRKAGEAHRKELEEGPGESGERAPEA